MSGSIREAFLKMIFKNLIRSIDQLVSAALAATPCLAIPTEVVIAHSPIDPEYPALDLPIRRTAHPAIGELDMNVNITIEILFADGTPVMEPLDTLILNF